MKAQYDFSKAVRGAVMPPRPGTTRVTLALDDEVLDWFQQQVHAAGGGNYQPMTNAALREHVARRGSRPE
ncbi:MAG TPA: BrnA antitoxin family protein [Longimicrobiaceae bacterium]